VTSAIRTPNYSTKERRAPSCQNMIQSNEYSLSGFGIHRYPTLPLRLQRQYSLYIISNIPFTNERHLPPTVFGGIRCLGFIWQVAAIAVQYIPFQYLTSTHSGAYVSPTRLLSSWHSLHISPEGVKEHSPLAFFACCVIAPPSSRASHTNQDLSCAKAFL
jgi:hypothetical protein